MDRKSYSRTNKQFIINKIFFTNMSFFLNKNISRIQCHLFYGKLCTCSIGFLKCPQGNRFFFSWEKKRSHTHKGTNRDIKLCIFCIILSFQFKIMATTLPRYLKYLSLIVMFFAILYKYEIPSSTDKKTLMFTKIATLQYDRAHVYKIITNIDKYASVCFKIC
jgi:hypothetical protein